MEIYGALPHGGGTYGAGRFYGVMGIYGAVPYGGGLMGLGGFMGSWGSMGSCPIGGGDLWGWEVLWGYGDLWGRPTSLLWGFLSLQRSEHGERPPPNTGEWPQSYGAAP